MTTRRIATVALAVAALLTLCAGFAWPPAASATTAQPTIGVVALQLGIKVPTRESDSFDLGASFTGLLEKPDKLAAFGIADMKEGARVVVARIGLDRVIVEADQLEPARSARVRLALDVMGRLSAPPRT
jgi:hypothetical protein